MYDAVYKTMLHGTRAQKVCKITRYLPNHEDENYAQAKSPTAQLDSGVSFRDARECATTTRDTPSVGLEKTTWTSKADLAPPDLCLHPPRMGPCSRTWTFPTNEIGGYRTPPPKRSEDDNDDDELLMMMMMMKVLKLHGDVVTS